MAELLTTFVHPITLAMVLGSVVAVDAWLIDRRPRRRSAPPPDRPA